MSLRITNVVNFCPIFTPPGNPKGDLDDRDLREIEQVKKFAKTSFAYANEHATRPSTIGMVLSSSPLALLAWFLLLPALET